MGVNLKFSDMRRAFKHVDLDNSGTVSRNELERALELWNVPMTQERLDALWRSVDTTGDGEIDYGEFVHALARDTVAGAKKPEGKASKKISFEEQAAQNDMSAAEDQLNSRFSDMHKAFKFVDADNSGTINRSELERALELWNLPLKRRQVRSRLGSKSPTLQPQGL